MKSLTKEETMKLSPGAIFIAMVIALAALLAASHLSRSDELKFALKNQPHWTTAARIAWENSGSPPARRGLLSAVRSLDLCELVRYYPHIHTTRAMFKKAAAWGSSLPKAEVGTTEEEVDGLYRMVAEATLRSLAIAYDNPSPATPCGEQFDPKNKAKLTEFAAAVRGDSGISIIELGLKDHPVFDMFGK